MGLYSMNLDPGKSRHENRATIHVDQSDGRIIVDYNQDVSRVLRDNHDMRVNGDGFNKSRDMLHAAQIPTNVFQKMVKEIGLHPSDPGFQPALLQMLEDPDYEYLKTTTYKVASRRKQYFHSSAAEMRPVYKSEEIVNP